MLHGLNVLVSNFRELPVYEGVLAPVFRWLARVATWPLLQIIMWIIGLNKRIQDPLLNQRVRSMFERWLRGGAFLTVASQNVEQFLLGISPSFPVGEGNWITFFGRLMLAGSVVESMPLPPAIGDLQHRCNWKKLQRSVRRPRQAWLIWKPDIQRFAIKYMIRLSPVLVIVTTVAPGWPGWVAFSLALGQYLLLGVIRCEDEQCSVTGIANQGVAAVQVVSISHPQPRPRFHGLDSSQLTGLEKRQKELAHHVRMLCRGYSNALLVYSAQGGTGKSFTVASTMQEEGVTPVFVNSHVTAMELYRLLYKYRTNYVLFLDDVDGIFTSMAHLGLLRSALFGEPRIVTYLSSALPKDLPQQFEFHSRVVFCVNTLPKSNDAFNAVLTRCTFFELSATNDELLDVMRAVAQRGYDDLSPEQCLDVVNFIQEEAGDEGLSLRMLEPCLKCVIYADEEQIDWRPLVQTQLNALQQRATRNRS